MILYGHEPEEFYPYTGVKQTVADIRIFPSPAQVIGLVKAVHLQEIVFEHREVTPPNPHLKGLRLAEHSSEKGKSQDIFPVP